MIVYEDTLQQCELSDTASSDWDKFGPSNGTHFICPSEVTSEFFLYEFYNHVNCAMAKYAEHLNLAERPRELQQW
jgi:hypothetical protein